MPDSDHRFSGVTINGDRLWQSLMDMAKIGPGAAGGNNRQALTDADAEGRTLFREWCEDAGMSVSVDKIGNMFALRPGEDEAADPVCIGSHLDTQPTGGKFDGVLGVLAGLEIVRTLNDCGIATRRPIIIANWTNEEGARFPPPMLASGVFAGAHDLAWAYEREDGDGKTFGDELKRIGWLGDEEVGKRRFRAYFELHIEQGPILEAEERLVGVVTHGQGLRWLEVTLIGRESHTGSTPMGMRADATLGMAHLTVAVKEIATAHAPQAVGTVGRCEIRPNSRNTIAGEATFTADLRHPDQTTLEAMVEEFRNKVAAVATEQGLKASVSEIGGYDPVVFNPECVSAVREAAEKLGYPCRDLTSGAGHDACWISKVAPSAMVMCPCRDGLSHAESEDIRPEWAEAGTNVLCHAAMQIACLQE